MVGLSPTTLPYPTPTLRKVLTLTGGARARRRLAGVLPAVVLMPIAIVMLRFVSLSRSGRFRPQESCTTSQQWGEQRRLRTAAPTRMALDASLLHNAVGLVGGSPRASSRKRRMGTLLRGIPRGRIITFINQQVRRD